MTVSYPAFLDLPLRSSKPRRVGLTHVLDPGTPTELVHAQLDATAGLIDVWKFGYGTAYLDQQLPDKLALLERFGVRACIGGTLFEIAWLQGRLPAFLAWAEKVGFPCIEVSRGAVYIPLDEKRRVIERAAATFTVIAEVGSKRPDDPVDVDAWRDEACGDLEAGATWALAEGRASGTVGLYGADGSVRAELVDRLVTDVGVERLAFEAPLARQQAWFIRRFGADVNLGNVARDGVLSLEAMRLGLRADTIAEPASRPWSRAALDDRERAG